MTELILRLSPEELCERARRLRWLLLDVDGVLTDGRLLYGADGGVSKAFNIKDGFGIRLAHRAGLKVGTLSLRADPALAHRARELGLNAVLCGEGEKTAVFERFLAEQQLSAEQVAYAGDDWPDLPLLTRAGLAFAPADAAPEVRARVHGVLASPGGGGAVRELVELLLKARGEWEGLAP